MEPLVQLKQVLHGVNAFHASFVEEIDSVQDEGMRQYMTAVASRLKQLQAEVEKSFPKAVDAIQSQAAAAQKQNAGISQQIEKLKAKQAEAQAKAATAAQSRAEATAQVDAQLKAQAAAVAAQPREPDLPPMTPQLSDTLRDELLQRFGLKEAPRHKPAEFQEAAEDWQRSKPAEKTTVPV